jgi:uncharacterized protein YdaU (DUF1376 family)
MKWYKHDPDAFLVGTFALTLEERGAYITIIDLLYSRDGDVSEDVFARAMGRPQIWRRMKAALLAKGKLHYKTDGKLTANRVETVLKLAEKCLVSDKKHNNIKANSSVRARKEPEPEPDIRKKVEQISEPDGSAPLLAILTPSQIAERELFAVAKKAMGKSCGGLISSLIRHHNYDLTAARLVVDLAITKSDPREYLVATMRSSRNGAGRSNLEAGKRIDAQLKALGATDNYVPGSSGPRPLNLDQQMRPNGLRLIPKG